MAISISAAVASSMADVVTAAISAGSGPGTVKAYTGAKPATVATSATGTLLATWTLEDPAAGAAIAGVATMDTTPTLSATVAASGTAGYFRVSDSDGTAIFDGTVGISGADLNFSSNVWTINGTVNITAATYTQPLS